MILILFVNLFTLTHHRSTKPAQMLGADVAIGYVDENNAVTVTDSFISDRQAGLVCPHFCR
jgi:hypothetical protein